MTVKIKICGITNLDDARRALEYGADALGFNFYPKSPRYITPVEASRISEQMGTNAMAVGVFVNSELSEVADAIDIAGLDAVQLHGDESPEFLEQLRTISDCRIIKAFRISKDFDPRDTVDHAADGILLDGFSQNARGGTGNVFDWEIAKLVSVMVGELWLAGGLTAENVRSAVKEVNPYAVDACSSLESAPGIKDAMKLKSFITEAKRA